MAEKSDIEFRLAELADVRSIVELLWDDPQGQLRESNSANDLGMYETAFGRVVEDPNSDLVVAVIEGKTVGCLQLTIIAGLSYRGSTRGSIEDVRIDASIRGRGIGGQLLAYAEDLSKDRGCDLVELFVHADRGDAHRFYERAGYVGAHRGYRKPL